MTPEAAPGHELRDAAVTAINEISDPCALAAGAAIGLVDMGIVTSLVIDDHTVTVVLSPTFPGCLFVGLFEEAIRERVESLAPDRVCCVELSESEEIWTEAAMTETGRRMIHAARARALPRSGA